MTSPNPQPLWDAIRADITAAGVACAIGQKPSTATTRWVVLWPDAGTVTDKSLKSRDGFDVLLALHAYGLSPEAAGFALRKARAAVQAQAGEVFDGRTAQPPVNELGRLLDRDDDADPPVFWHYDEWRFRLTS